MDSTVVIKLRYKKHIPKEGFDHFTVLFLHDLIEEGYAVKYVDTVFEKDVKRYDIQLRYKGEHYSLTINNSRTPVITLGFSELTDMLKEGLIKEHDERIKMILDKF